MTPDHSRLVERLRERLITIRKPGAIPFDPPPNWWHTCEVGGEHKAGDSAGYASVNMSLTAASCMPSVFKMVEVVYAEEPLASEAAAAIESLSAELAGARAEVERLANSPRNFKFWADRLKGQEAITDKAYEDIAHLTATVAALRESLANVQTGLHLIAGTHDREVGNPRAKAKQLLDALAAAMEAPNV